MWWDCCWLTSGKLIQTRKNVLSVRRKRCLSYCFGKEMDVVSSCSVSNSICGRKCWTHLGLSIPTNFENNQTVVIWEGKLDCSLEFSTLAINAGMFSAANTQEDYLRGFIGVVLLTRWGYSSRNPKFTRCCHLFLERLIFVMSNMARPSNLCVCHFLLWRFLTTEALMQRLRAIAQLRKLIIAEVNATLPYMCKLALHNFR